MHAELVSSDISFLFSVVWNQGNMVYVRMTYTNVNSCETWQSRSLEDNAAYTGATVAGDRARKGQVMSDCVVPPAANRAMSPARRLSLDIFCDVV